MKKHISFFFVSLMFILSACGNMESFSSNELAFFDLRGPVSDVTIFQAETDDSFSVPDSLPIVLQAGFEDGEWVSYQINDDSISNVLVDEEGRISCIISHSVSVDNDSLLEARTYKYGEGIHPDTIVYLCGTEEAMEDELDSRFLGKMEFCFYDKDGNLSVVFGRSCQMSEPEVFHDTMTIYKVVEVDEHGNWTERHFKTCCLEDGIFDEENPDEVAIKIDQNNQRCYVERRLITYVGEE